MALERHPTDLLDAVERHRLLSIARDSLRASGYADQLVLEDYAFADVLAPSEPTRVIPLAAFGQDPPSYRTACWGVSLGPAATSDFRALGAPQVLEMRSSHVLRWKVVAEGPPQLLEQVPADRLVDLLRDHREDWGPRAVLRTKGIPLDLKPRQLDFYDIGLLPIVDHAVFSKLDRMLRDALGRATHIAAEHQQRDAEPDALVRLVFRLLAAKVIVDRGDADQTLQKDVSAALAVASHFYGESTQRGIARVAAAAEAAAWRVIASSFNLRNISVEALAHVYENTLVSKEHRRATGTHATPPAIAEYVVRHLPFESLPADERLVFEPFAGHAAFLIAALGRLRELLPPDLTNQQRHDRFVQSLVGMERDPFALEVARLSLVLADYPNHNGWNLIHGDVFTHPATEQLSRDATVVLCNPPFEWLGQSDRAQYQDEVLSPAVTVLNRVLINPPALLGFVLPSSFVDGRSFAGAKRKIVQAYGQVDTIGLPDNVFQNSGVEAVILLASERDKYVSTRFRCAQVRKQDYDRFLQTWQPSWRTERVITTDEVGVAPNLWLSPLDQVWDRMRHLPTLEDVAIVHRGIEYTLPFDSHQNELVSLSPKPGFVRGLQAVGDGFEPYFTRGEVYLNAAPELMRRRAHLYPWAEPKVIANAARLGRGPWRVAAVPDTSGLVCYQRFHGLWPRQDVDLPIEVLAAVLNGPVANGFLSSVKGSRDVTVTRLRAVPFPSMTRAASEAVVQMVRDYRIEREGRAQGLDSPGDALSMQWWDNEEGVGSRGNRQEGRLRELLTRIDAEILSAYDLPPRVERELLNTFEGFKRPGPVPFFGYYPAGFRPALPLRFLTSPQAQEATAISTLSRLPVLRDPVISEVLTSIDYSDDL